MIASYPRKQTRLKLKKRAERPASDYGCHSNAGSIVFPSFASWEFIWLPVRRRHPSHCLCGKWTPSPSSFFEQAFEVLPCCSHQGFTVDSPQSS